MELVNLRAIKLEDTDNILKWKNNVNVKKYFCIQDDLTKEQHMQWLKNRVDTDEVVQFVIESNELKKDVGSVYLRDIDNNNQKAEFGIFIGEDDARNKGIGTAATKKIIEYGFKHLKLHKIYLRVFAENINAIRAYEKAGFEYEGTAKDHIKLPNGKYQSIIFMAIFNSINKS